MSLAAEALGFTEVPIRTNDLLVESVDGVICPEITFQVQENVFDYLDAPIRRITSADAPMHYAPNLTALAIPDVTRTVKLVKEVMYMKK